MRRSDRFSREYLLQATWLHEDIFDRSIDVQVLRLRRKLEVDPKAPRVIRTERGVGYVFNSGRTKPLGGLAQHTAKSLMVRARRFTLVSEAYLAPSSINRDAPGTYQGLGITVERVMTDNGSCCKSFSFLDACKRLGLKPTRTKPYTPRPMARPNASFKPACASGLTLRPTTPQRNAPPSCQDGFTAIIGTGLIPVSARSHRSADSLWPRTTS
jgi:hypothetical protein